jgi:hypothetical protein
VKVARALGSIEVASSTAAIVLSSNGSAGIWRRPALSNDRLQRRPDGPLRQELKTPWLDGTAAIVLAPLDLIAGLYTLVPPPRFNPTRFHGVLAAAARLRGEFVSPPPPQELSVLVQLPLFGTADSLAVVRGPSAI